MKNILSNVIVIIQRSNGDVFFANSLIQNLKNNFPFLKIDLLVNDDTIQIAKLIPNISQIITFSYKEKSKNRWAQEKKILKRIFRKYDLSINLTASDRSVLYSWMASKNSISAIEKNSTKSWWKKILIRNYYFFDPEKHIIENNLTTLDILGLRFQKEVIEISVSDKVLEKISEELKKLNVDKFIIFHPSAQYDYKIYPQELRKKLLNLLKKVNIPIIVTGGTSKIDLNIKDSIPNVENIINLIGETSIEEYIALSHLSIGYIGMDTLNMHIAASQNKRIFAIYGPTNLKMWSPWSNISMTCAAKDKYINEYENITIFQADLPCVACGKAGCNDQHDESICLNHINPELVYQKIQNFINDQAL